MRSSEIRNLYYSPTFSSEEQEKAGVKSYLRRYRSLTTIKNSIDPEIHPEKVELIENAIKTVTGDLYYYGYFMDADTVLDLKPKNKKRKFR